MNTALDLGLLALTLLVAFGAPVLLVVWIRAAADWCWLLAIRRRLVGVTSAVIFLRVTARLRGAVGLHFSSPLAVRAGLFATPLATVPIANATARRLSTAAERGLDPKWRGFIFRQRRREQSAAYSAPSAEN